MSTRSQTYVIVNDEYRMRHYKISDGYPKGLGWELLEYLQCVNLKALSDKLDAYRPFFPDVNLVSFDSEKMKEDYGILMSPVEVFQKLMRSKMGVEIPVSPHENEPTWDWIKDTFLEYAYVINFDRGVFEVVSIHPFYGFNFPFTYQPGLKLIARYLLSKLPDKSTFLSDCGRFQSIFNRDPSKIMNYVFFSDEDAFTKAVWRAIRLEAAESAV